MRVAPISTLRFLLASWVVLSHYGVPILADHRGFDLPGLIRAAVGVAFNGPAAVIVFFVISGFCIHFPNRNGIEVTKWSQYFIRRYTRTLLPMFVAFLIATPIGIPFGLFTDSILWSLLCEEIYYLMYPVLITIRRRVSFTRLFGLATLGYLMLAVSNPSVQIYPAFGPALTWIIGLPCWLLGCVLAERYDHLPNVAPTQAKIWIFRLGVWLSSSIALILRFHLKVGYVWTLNLFAVIAAVWIEREFSYYKFRRAPRLEVLGEASYSIYLTHLTSAAILSYFELQLSRGSLWVLTITLTALTSLLFYLLVERPSHTLARSLSRAHGRKRAAAAA